MSKLRSPSRLLPLGLLGVAGVALAGSWSDFKAAFPSLPCQDGWAACIVDGSPVSPGMVLDAKGRPHPSDMRLGFFDFDPLPTLSPFAGLSAYTGEGVEAAGDEDAVADAAAPPPQLDDAAVAAEREAAREATEAARQAEASAAAAEAEAQARARAEAEARAQQEAARKAAEEAAAAAASAQDAAAKAEAERRAQEARKAAEEAARKAESERAAAEAARKAAEEEARKRAEAEAARQAAEAARVAAEAEARRVAEEAARKAAEDAAARKAQEEAAAAAAASAAAAAAASSATPVSNTGGDAVAMATTPPAETAAPASCDNLVALEVPAMMGQLGAGVRTCLEKNLSASGSQTEKDKISRVLIADAEARQDQASWEKLMKRHLENIDRSDPNLCFKYALFLSRGGASRAFGVIRWADYALENKQQWSGAAYTKNVNALYKIRAQAANKLWQSAEQKLVDDRSDENEADSEKYRGMTKDYAREWLDYARASSQDTSAAMALCVSAAGNKEFCSG